MQKGLVGLLGSVICLSGSVAAQEKPARWFGNYEEAIQEAKRTQKPIFLEYRCEP